jgi:hypothetical protein
VSKISVGPVNALTNVRQLTLCLASLGAGHKSFLPSPKSIFPPRSTASISYNPFLTLPQSATVQPDQSPTPTPTNPKPTSMSDMSPSPQAFAMAIASDPSGPQAKHLLEGRSGADVMQIMRSLKSPAAQAAFAAALLSTPSAASKPSAVFSEKTKKALNAYIGFRCKLHLPPLGVSS